MKEIARYSLILALICAIAAGLLAVVNRLTAPEILAAAQREEQAALKEVLPQASEFNAVKSEANKETIYYRGLNAQGKIVGYVFKAAGKGYSSVIETLVGIFPDGKINAIKVVSLSETPGLGMRVTENKFTHQFKQLSSLDLSGVEAITGATISSGAVINSVQAKAQEIKELIKNDK